ncbi:LysM peptidoglycan-binding domain-containing protein [Streptomyces smyrnaeus]|uniref:LysM peptidoglycan-binding domain-containing protein n=1 Tax=Streptomyces smyrnaeus TaxID=1387713 RepID=UPI0036792192
MNVNTIVLHTTEGTFLPSYGGGASAPTLTAVPDMKGKRLRWYQHFDFERSARALVNKNGGVETNTLNVAQVELVGTCDPSTHKKWKAKGYSHIYWPDAPDWALKEVAAFLKWANREHAVPLSGPSSWKAYPSSYGNTSQRMTFSEWNNFRGICGHCHVPENDHGDPGAIDFVKLIRYAKGDTGKPPTSSDTYTVKKGDTLSSIARAHNTTVAALVKANGIKDADKIRIGQVLKLTGSAPKPKPTYAPFPGAAYFKKNPNSSLITRMGKRLVAQGCGKYRVGPGPQWTDVDRQSYAAWQRKLGYSGSNADGWPGKASWDRLKVPAN